jgi:hypothetical protein
MPALGFALNPADSATWLIPGVGVAVAASVVGLVALIGRWRRRRRRRRPVGSREEDLPWPDLLELLRHHRGREQDGASPEGEVPPDQLLKELMAVMPAASRPAPEEAPDDLPFLTQGGVEKRTGRRRWGNPTEVHLDAGLWPRPVHGIVINRSTGGLAILLKEEVPAGTSIEVHPVEAPRSVPATKLEVRHCRKAGQLFLIGCEFCEEIPWNVRVWFG